MCDNKVNKQNTFRMRKIYKRCRLNEKGEIVCTEDNEVEYEAVNSNSAIAKDLRKWAWDHKIADDHLDSLLKILKTYVPSLPSSHESLFNLVSSENQVQKMDNVHDNLDSTPELIYVDSELVGEDHSYHSGHSITKTEESNKFTHPGNNSMEEQLSALMKRQFSAFQTSLIDHIDTKFQYFEKAIDTKLVNLQVGFNNIVTEGETVLIQRPLPSDEENYVSFRKLMETYDYQFPITTMEDFVMFDNYIKENKNLYEDLKNHLLIIINTNKSVKDNMTMICKKFLSRDVLIKHTSQRKHGDKPILSTTNFYNCLEESIYQSYSFAIGKAMEKKTILQSLGSVINNSIDWDGHRLKRAKTKEEETA